MNKKVAVILVNAPGYAEKFLDDCVSGLRAQDYAGEMKIFMVDNSTTGESFEYLAKNIPEAELILNKENRGFAGGNNDGMRQAIFAGFDYVFLLNLDVEIEKDCIRHLVDFLENDKTVGAAQARLMLHPETEKINSLGNITHFLGFGYSEGYNEKLENIIILKQKEICYPSGAAVMFPADVLKAVGLFDEELWMYNEDQDLGWRIWLFGYKCALASDAVVYHKYEFKRSAGKYYWLDRNRMIVAWKNYHILTLILILPAFFVMEIGLVLFSFKSGWWLEKKKVWQYFLKPWTWKYLFRARREAQGLRKVKDSVIVDKFSGRIWHQEINDFKLRAINPVFEVYWKIVLKVIKFLKL